MVRLVAWLVDAWNGFYADMFYAWCVHMFGVCFMCVWYGLCMCGSCFGAYYVCVWVVCVVLVACFV